MPRGPGHVNDDEVVVASREELHAAPLSGKRLLALWNALPGVENRRKIGDRAALNSIGITGSTCSASTL